MCIHTYVDNETIDEDDYTLQQQQLRLPNRPEKKRPPQRWGNPLLLSDVDKLLRKEFVKISQIHPHMKVSQIPNTSFVSACNVAKHYLVPLKEVYICMCVTLRIIHSVKHIHLQVRCRYAEYRADREAHAFDKGSVKLFDAFNADDSYNRLCALLAGTWGSSVTGWTPRDGWLVQIGTDGCVIYSNPEEGIEFHCDKLEMMQLSGACKSSALCIRNGGSTWRLNYVKSSDNYLVWNLHRASVKDRESEAQNIVYERIN